MSRAATPERTRFLLVALTAALTGCATSSPVDDAADRRDDAVTAAQCAAAKPWAAWTAYATGAVVTYGGTYYQCLQGHTSQPDWTPSAVPALWSHVTCSGGGSSSGGSTSTSSSTSSTSSSSSSSSTSSSGGGTCDPGAWVYMGNDANACVGHVGESCGWTTTNLGQGYHCQTVSWGVGCEPGGTTCPGGSTSSSSSSSSTSTSSSSSSSTSSSSSSGGVGNAAGLIFSPYKDTGINMNWNTNVIQTNVSGSPKPLASDLAQHGGKAITLAFATGECGSENWGGVPGAQMATANVSGLQQSGVKYIVSTGGAAGSFTCGSDAGMTTFINRWASSGLVGVDFDIEAGQSQAIIDALIQRIKAAHGSYPGLRFSLTLATLANNAGAGTAQSLGGSAPDSFNVYGDWALAAVKTYLGWNGSASTWPSYVTVNLMTMDYGSPSSGICVVSGGACQMGQSALQAAYNLHDHWGVPYGNIELTPMIGGNDTAGEVFTLADADTVAKFALAKGLAGVHYWSYDRDVDCPPGSASATCNSLGTAGAYGFLSRFLSAGLH